MSSALAVRLPDDLAARLDAASKVSRRPKSSYIVEGLEQVLTRVEWEQEILRRVADIDAGRTELIPAEDVRRHLGLDS